MRVRGFAELTFGDSARFSFARACERGSDVTLDHPEAWVVDDRRISFAIDCEMQLGEIDAHRRLLEDLATEAKAGEAYLDVEGQERWVVVVGQATSGAPGGRTSGSEDLETTQPDLTTIRVQRG